MSAIFGIIDFEGRPIDPAWIKSMQEDLAHRGPDGEGLYQDDSIVMGHKLLQVTPESIYDKSPYEEDGLVITSNARLDEREAIMDRLDIPQTERETITDPLLLLRSFKKYGKDFVKDIYGDFSFAIWDKVKKELFCARDQIGVKPFLYYFQDGRFVFSTEMKSIVQLAVVKTSLNQKYLKNIATFISNDIHVTTWENIFRLKPANILSVSSSDLKTNQYWFPIYHRNPKYKTEEDTASQLLSLLKKIISDHTRVIGEVGFHLSGGLDSSTVACLAAKNEASNGKSVTSVSSILGADFNDEEYSDEMEYIQAVLAQETTINPLFVEDKDLKFLDQIDEKFDRHYCPINLHYYLDEAIYEKFKSKSIRRVLTGFLGDSTVSNRFISPLPYLLVSGQIIAFLSLSMQIRKHSKISIFSLLKNNVMLPLAPNFLVNAWIRYKSPDRKFDLSFWPFNLSKKELKLLESNWINCTSSRQKVLDLSNEVWSANDDCFEEDWDCGSSHHQVEMSHPLGDRRLIEFLLEIPVEHFYMGGLKRGLIKSAMLGYLPELVRTRTDKGPYSPSQFKIFQKDFPEIKKIMANNGAIDQTDCPINMEKMISLLDDLVSPNKKSIFETKYWTTLVWSLLSVYYIWISKQFKKNYYENESEIKMDKTVHFV